MISSNDGDELEKDADMFAKNIMIPRSQYDQFVAKGKFDRESIQLLAKTMQIHPGFVVGRLQKENILKYHQFNDMRQTINTIKPKLDTISYVQPTESKNS